MQEISATDFLQALRNCAAQPPYPSLTLILRPHLLLWLFAFNFHSAHKNPRRRCGVGMAFGADPPPPARPCPARRGSGPVRRVSRIGRPAIGTHCRGETAKLLPLLGCVMVFLAQALERPVPEPVRVAVVALDVIADESLHQLSLLTAHAAIGFPLELGCPHRPPCRGVIPGAPALGRI